MAVDTAAALRKLQSGQTLTAAESTALGLTPKVDPLQSFLDYAKTRPAELDALAVDLQSKTPTPIKPINQMTPEELDAYQKARVGAQTEFRETGGGTTPPYPAGPNEYWSFVGGQWKLYKRTPVSTGGGPGAGAGGGTDSTDATNKSIAAQNQAAIDAANLQARQSAYDLLYSQFKQYGLESLVEGIKDLIQKDVSPSQFTIELRNSPAYLKRFAANAARVKAGYKALDEGTYLALEDSYQNLMRNYGLPASYWEKGELGVQPGFEKLIAGNVDPVELEQRLVQAVDQIEKGPKEYMDAIKQFYPEISRSDLLSYVLDPENALKTIQSKVKAAQIGGEYLRAGLGTDVTRASELATQGVTADIARASIPTIMETAKRGGELAGFYGNAGLGLYDQATAEEEIYNLGKAAEAKKKREKLVGLEQASFAGQYGGAQGALDRGRSGAY